MTAYESVPLKVDEPAGVPANASSRAECAASVSVAAALAAHLLAMGLCWLDSRDATPLPCAGHVLALFCAAACACSAAWSVLLLLRRAHTRVHHVLSEPHRRPRSLSV